LIIRQATDADRPVWAAMLAKLHQHQSAAGEFERELAVFTRLPEPYVGFVAFSEDGEPVGLIDARVRNFAEGAPNLRAAYVEDLWVAPEHRGKGIATELLGHVERWARDQGLDWLGSDARPDNAESHKWHRANGFDEVERLVVFGKLLD
jgi:aminoglycoside 6'-N-acetyltransferase I